MTATLIINADDFGFSPGVTDGILQCHRAGVLTSTTLMTTMPDRDRALELALATPTLGVGIHLCLTQGQALTPCRRIRNRDGSFPRSLPQLAWRLLRPAAQREAVEEWAAQVDYAIRRGLTPTHLDSHKHIHHLPALHAAVMEVAGRFGVRCLRCARELPLLRGSVPYAVLAGFARRLAQKLPAAHLRTTDWFFGLATTGRTTLEVWQQLLAALPAGVGEVMVHPGYIHGIGPSETRLLQARLDEQAALLDPRLRSALDGAQVALAHYGSLR